MSTDTLVQKILSRDFAGANEAFEALVAEKVSSALEEQRDQIAQALYGEELDEEAEELDELSKKTLASYADKATGDAIRQGQKSVHHDRKGELGKSIKATHKRDKRYSGVRKALDRLSK